MTYAMLTGREPFVGDDAAALMHQVVHLQPPPVSDSLSWDTSEIQAVLDRALAKRQADCFDSIESFAWAFRVAAHSVMRGHARAAVIPRTGDMSS